MRKRKRFHSKTERQTSASLFDARRMPGARRHSMSSSRGFHVDCVEQLWAPPHLFRSRPGVLKTMARFHVFLKAPTSAEFAREDDEHTRQWHTFSTASPLGSADITADSAGAVGLPSATLEAASRRISMHYENVIFKDVTSEDEDEEARDVPGNTQGMRMFDRHAVARPESHPSIP